MSHRGDSSGLMAFLGPAVFAFECAPTALNIYASMGRIEPDPFLRVNALAYVTGLALILSVAIVGYMGFGGDVHRVVLFSFPRTPVGLSAQYVINVMLFLSFNLQMIPIYQIAEDKLLPWLRARRQTGDDLSPQALQAWQLFAARFAARSSVSSRLQLCFIS